MNKDTAKELVQDVIEDVEPTLEEFKENIAQIVRMTFNDKKISLLHLSEKKTIEALLGVINREHKGSWNKALDEIKEILVEEINQPNFPFIKELVNTAVDDEMDLEELIEQTLIEELNPENLDYSNDSSDYTNEKVIEAIEQIKLQRDLKTLAIGTLIGAFFWG